MPQVLISVAKALGMFFVRKMLLKLALDMLEEAMEKGAKKSEYEWDDKFVVEFKKHRDELEKLINFAA